MSKYTPKSIYGTLFTTLYNLSDSDQKYLFTNVFTDEFLTDITENPKRAYSVLNNIVVDMGKTFRN